MILKRRCHCQTQCKGCSRTDVTIEVILKPLPKHKVRAHNTLFTAATLASSEMHEVVEQLEPGSGISYVARPCVN